jgi:hypothetical protein
MIRAFVEELGALLAIALFVTMVLYWASVITGGFIQ